MRENQFSTWFSHDEYVGVKCMRTLPCRTRKSRTRWVLWLLTLSQMTWISCRSHWLATMSVRKATNCSLVWRAAVLPSTWPVAVFSAANKLSVPFLLYSNPWLSARPGDSGSIRSWRSSAWMALFSSTQNTTACAGGWRYRPITSAALVSQSGSLDTMCRSSLCHLPRQLQSELTPVSPPPPCPCAGSPKPSTPRRPALARARERRPRHACERQQADTQRPPEPPFARRIVRRRLGNGRERGGCDDGLHRSHRQRDRGVVGCDGLVCGVARDQRGQRERRTRRRTLHRPLAGYRAPGQRERRAALREKYQRARRGPHGDGRRRGAEHAHRAGSAQPQTRMHSAVERQRRRTRLAAGLREAVHHRIEQRRLAGAAGQRVRSALLVPQRVERVARHELRRRRRSRRGIDQARHAHLRQRVDVGQVDAQALQRQAARQQVVAVVFRAALRLQRAGPFDRRHRPDLLHAVDFHLGERRAMLWIAPAQAQEARVQVAQLDRHPLDGLAAMGQAHQLLLVP